VTITPNIPNVLYAIHQIWSLVAIGFFPALAIGGIGGWLLGGLRDGRKTWW
jgi:hypothetical protein